MNSTLEETENRRLGFKNEIKTYTDKIKKLEEKMKMLEDEKKELQDRINLTSSISSQTMKESEHFKGLLQEYKKGKEEVEYQLNTCIEKCSKLLEENESYKQAIFRHEEESGKMAQKLAELKNLYIRVNLRNQMFHVKKEGLLSNTEIDIIFGKGKNGNYVMRIDEKDQTELMNIQDVEYVNRVEGSKNKVEISYMYQAKKYYIIVLVDELIVDQFVEAYKIFYLESMKDQNQIAY
jgi:chromosome segregation ATPase